MANLQTTSPNFSNEESNQNDGGQGMAPLEASMVCVSVVEEGSQIAFASYDEDKNTVVIEQSFANGYDVEAIVERFFAATRPNLVLVGNKIAANETLLHLLTRPLAASEEGSNGRVAPPESDPMSDIQGSIPYRLLKSGAFDVRKCRALIVQKLRVIDLLRKSGDTARRTLHAISIQPSSGQTAYQASAYHALASVVDFSSNIQVKALGSLVSFLQSTIYRLEEGGTVTINSIQQAKSSMFMRINVGALRALHIFATEHHPILSKGQGHSKEGFSLFSLLDRTKSKMGRACLKDWMLKPLVDMEAITGRQDGIELFLRTEFQTAVGGLLNLLQQLGAVDKILLRMQKCHTIPTDFVVLYKTLSAAIHICDSLCNDFLNPIAEAVENDNSGEAQVFYRKAGVFIQNTLSSCNSSVLKDLYDRVSSTIDHDETFERKTSVAIKQGFHEELDGAKEAISCLDEKLSAVASAIIGRHPELKNIKVIFFPQVGFLVWIDKRQHEHDPESNYFRNLPQDFSCLFVQENDAYFKNDDVRYLDDSLGDLDAYIKDTESMIVSDLEDDILDCEPDLRSTFSALAELDCILCLASCAHDLNFVRPQILDDGQGTILISKGRHPLQELIVETDYIPNDTEIDRMSRVNVITGPNFSGKSTYLRQVGVLVYMAHIGSFLPCEKAQISITHQILTRISTVETSAIPQSTFQLDLSEMGTILRKSTSSTLVLVDEFGKGTHPTSGIAVLTAALKKLSQMRCRVVCTTHLLEVFSLGLLQDGLDGVKANQMAVLVPENGATRLATPLFKLQAGVASSSAGLVCAERAGLQRSVIDRAEEIIHAMKEGGQILPNSKALQHNPSLTQADKDAIRFFLSRKSWRDAREEDIRRLMHYISRM